MRESILVGLTFPFLAGAIHINPVPPAPPGSGIPYWSGPRLHASQYIVTGEPFGGKDVINGTEYKQLLFANPEIGTYNHAAMISYFNGQFLASWKNSPKDEDQNGQRVLYTQSFDGGETWTEMSNNGSTNELFPSMASDSNPNVHLFAEPSIIINNHLYAAASPIQFCLYPDMYQDVLLLREVKTENGLPGQLGPLFWASNEIPSDYYDASIMNNVVGFIDMDNETQSILGPFLSNPGSIAPCDLNNEFTTKCEWCENGCQSTDFPSPLENERTHYIVPSSSINQGNHQQQLVKKEEKDEEEDHNNDSTSQVDVILYRSRVKGEVNHLYAGVRNGTNQEWNVNITETNIADDVSNINAGNLPDGRVYLVSNAMVNVVRDPLYVSISEDGYKFDHTYVVASCEMDVFKSSSEEKDEHNADLQGKRWGCAKRYTGGSKQGGVQYPQAMVVTEAAGDASGFWVIFSLNKEDIWIAKVPLTF